MFPSSFIFCICTRSIFSSYDQLGSWEKSVTTGHLYVPYKLFISKCSLIKTRFIIWTIETFCWRQGRDRRADIDTGRPGYYHHQCQVSGNSNSLQMSRWRRRHNHAKMCIANMKTGETVTASNEHPDSIGVVVSIFASPNLNGAGYWYNL